MSHVPLLDLFLRETTITVAVKGLENFSKLFLLGARNEAGSNERESGGFKSVVLVELGQVDKSLFGLSLVDNLFGFRQQPGVLESLLSGGALCRIESKELGNEVFCFGADVVPNLV
jgi:hypothetical protein